MLKAYYADVYADIYDVPRNRLDVLSVNAHSMKEAAILFDEIAAMEYEDTAYLTNYRAVEDIAGANETSDGNGEIAWAGEVKWHDVVMGVLTVNARTEILACLKMEEILDAHGHWDAHGETLNIWEYGLWAAFTPYVEAA